MAYRIHILRAAAESIDKITTYLEGFGGQAAESFVFKFESQVDLIASGIVDYGLSHLPELADKGYHSCQINNYVMLYYYEDDEVVIAHIFHQSQDYARWI